VLFYKNQNIHNILNVKNYKKKCNAQWDANHQPGLPFNEQSLLDNSLDCVIFVERTARLTSKPAAISGKLVFLRILSVHGMERH
jgi:hypothetical protein